MHTKLGGKKKETVKKRNVKKPVKINNFVALNGKPNSQNSTKIAMKGERKNPGTRKNNQPVKDEIIIFFLKIKKKICQNVEIFFMIKTYFNMIKLF